MAIPPHTLKLTECSVAFAERLFELADPVAHEMGLTGGQVAEGAAIFAGIIVRHNARPGEAPVVGAMAAMIVERLTGARTVN